jgi:hypothetical protein
LTCLVGVVACLLLGAGATLAAPAGVTSSKYRLPAKVDPDIASDVATQVWARVYRPRTLSAPPYPLLLFLHGNHATCGRTNPDLGIRIDDDITYTFEGRCPSGYTVTPNHLGYAYLTEELAKAGYVVVSINANRGVNAADGVEGDFGLNLRRGRLVLKHLQLLARWNRAGGTPGSVGVDLRGKLDLGQVGLMGHSRGGEGMRAALAQFRDRGSPWPSRIGSGTRFKALYEIGPVDGQTDRVLNAAGVAWNVLLPYCDGDVSSLEGVQVFDRLLLVKSEPAKLPKSTFAVWGANHNFYNTEWQESDSPGCADHAALFPQLKGSGAQRATALRSLVPFFRAHVGRSVKPSLAALFDPLVALPTSISSVTRVDRGYTDTPDKTVELRLEDFDRPTGTSSYGQTNRAQGITIEHLRPLDHDQAQRAAAINWTAAGKQRLLQTNWTPPGAGRDIAAYRTSSSGCRASAASSAMIPTRSTALQQRTCQSSWSARTEGCRPAVRLSDHFALRGPSASGTTSSRSSTRSSPPHDPAQRVRPGITSVRGVRFTFDRTPTGAVYLANIRSRGAARATVSSAAVAASEASADAAA